MVSIERPQLTQPAKPFDFALATDYKATRSNAKAGRQIFGLKDGEMIFVRCYCSESSARRQMARMGVENYVFLDGGSSTPPSAKIPTRLVVVPRQLKPQNASALALKPGDKP